MEDKIIWNLLKNENYFKRIVSYLESDYFSENKDLFDILKKYISQYKSNPSFDDLDFFLENDNSLTEVQFQIIKTKLDKIKISNFELNQNTFLSETEKFIKEMALRNAILLCADIIEKDKSKETIPSIIAEAFTKDISLDIGQDYFVDFNKRLDYYSSKNQFIPTTIKSFNKMLGGGFEKKAIYLFAGKQNVGKTLTMTSIASELLRQNRNILYITGEMSEEKIAMRIDSNLLDIPSKDLKYMNITPDHYLSKLTELKNKCNGQLIIKEFPTRKASVLKIETYIEELKIKKYFEPEFVIIDYLGLFNSSILQGNLISNKYLYLQSVLEEFRALAIKFNTTFITAHQINRYGAKQKHIRDVDDTDIADSYGLLFASDFSAIIFQNEEQKQNNKILFKIVKTRSDENNNEIFNFDINYQLMKISESSDQKIALENSVPLSSLESGRFVESPKFTPKKLNKMNDNIDW